MEIMKKYRFAVAVVASFVIVFFAGLGYSLKGNTYEKENEVSKNLVTEQPKVNPPKLYNISRDTDTDNPSEEAEKEEPSYEAVFVPDVPERYIYPCKGEVTGAYSEKPVYSKTLEDWRAHCGLDISASEGQEVIASASGTVEDVYFDTMYGYTVTIAHTGGTRTLYANLSGDVTVSPGQTVREGELIGYAGSTASGEINEDGHIHFEMHKDNKKINPTEHLTNQ